MNTKIQRKNLYEIRRKQNCIKFKHLMNTILTFFHIIETYLQGGYNYNILVKNVSFIALRIMSAIFKIFSTTISF